ncbi:MAG: alpha/beta hydrolase [Anaerolineae bacterium]|nr:alpha/beta hydrolase [Anaerolineae bacterium]
MQTVRIPDTTFKYSKSLQRKAAPQTAQSIAPLVAFAGALSMIGAGLATAAYLRRNIQHNLPQLPALGGELRFLDSNAGALAYYSSGAHKRGSTAMLLVHSINAAASSYEMKPLYDHYTSGSPNRKIYALDLPGFGLSDRRSRDYSPAFYRDTLIEFMQQKFRGRPVDVVSLSLGCEFVALAAQKAPQLFRRLIFISPSGLALEQKIQPNDKLLRFLQVPAWSRLIFDALTSRPSLNYFLRQSQRNFDQGLADYAYQTSHQLEATHAPFHFISGKLFSSNMVETYASLTQPSLALFGQGEFAKHEMADELRNLEQWRLVEFRRCGSLVHFDDLAGVVTQINRHLK